MRSTMAICLITLTLGSAQAQWLNHRDPKIPRTKDGRPNLSAPAPRMGNRPDLSGVWQAERITAAEGSSALGEGYTQVQVDFDEVSKYYINLFWDVKPGEEPLLPAARARMDQRDKSGERFPPEVCLPESVPGGLLVLNFKMIQTPDEVIVLWENQNPGRQIYTDGRSLPADPNPSWVGNSVGRWQGDTLVVETVGITERAWLDGFGHPRSEKMRITERYRRRDVGHMDLEVTMEDPTYYTRPFSIKTTLYLMPDTDVLEYVCAENEKDLEHTK